MTAVMTLALSAFAAIFLGLLIAARRPDRFRVTRTAVIKAPAARVFALINDLKTFNTWSRCLHRDAGVHGLYSGPAGGVGAACTWQIRQTGSASLTITRSEAPVGLAMTLAVTPASPAHHGADFTLWAEGDNLTIVTWVVHGPAPYLARVKGLFVDTDRAIGNGVEADLANLKRLAHGR